MGANTKIQWCHDTFNPWRGCTKVSAGCANCYAAAMARINPKQLGVWGDDGVRVIAGDKAWREPLRWNALAEKTGRRRRVFCGSMMDVFEDRPELDAPRRRLFDVISETTELDWMLLTKRPENVEPILRRLFNGPGKIWEDQETWYDPLWLPNVWIGTSVEDQTAADTRLPILGGLPATIRFISCEPLLGPVDLSTWIMPPGESALDLVICGGESGPKARPMHPDWARSLRDQCAAAGVPFFFKQWGEWVPIDEPWQQESPKPLAPKERWMNVAGGHGFHGDAVWRMRRVGKHAAGYLLDGRHHHELPGQHATSP